jgi:curved DNA-binding protein CbpA
MTQGPPTVQRPPQVQMPSTTQSFTSQSSTFRGPPPSPTIQRPPQVQRPPTIIQQQPVQPTVSNIQSSTIPQRLPKKLPTNYPVVEEDPNLIDGYTCFEILGVKPTDSMEHIETVYKKLIIVLHPDKAITSEARKLGWTEEEKNEAFENVRKAYKILKSQSHNFRKVPDYNVNYSVTSDYTNPMNTNMIQQQQNNNHHQQPVGPSGPIPSVGLSGLSGPSGPSGPMGFNMSNSNNNAMFNQKFEAEKSRQERDGFADPMSVGYNNIFNTSEEEKIRDRSMMRAGMGRSTIDVTKDPKRETHKMNSDGTLTRYEPLGKTSIGVVSNGLNFSDLGLTKIDDFSTTVKCSKGSLECSDLMQVYGTDKEYWEDSFNRDKELSAKYHDNTSVEKKMNMHLNERKGFDPLSHDASVTRAINLDEQRYEALERSRLENLKKVDTYYQQRNIGF